MRFLRLTRMAHILSLVVLMITAMPFVAFDASKSQGDHGHIVAMDTLDCNAHVMVGGNDAACPGTMLHCMTLIMMGRISSEPKAVIVYLHHPFRSFHAESISPESSSPPPRA
jgi:hypothetical protein